MKRIIPNIAVESCKEALDFYHDVFGGEVSNLQMADGKSMFQGHEGKVIHAELHINADCILYFNDPIGPKTKGDDISILLQMSDMDEINNVYEQLRQGGEVSYELQKTFWGSYHAVLTDRHGINWSLDFAGK